MFPLDISVGMFLGISVNIYVTVSIDGSTDICIPLEQVVHNRLHSRITPPTTVSRQLGNPISETQ